MRILSGALLAVAALGCGAAHAQDNLMFADMNSELTAPRYFEGLYAGYYLGAVGNDHHNYFTTGNGEAWGGGGILGYHYYVTDGLVIGAEVQGGAGYDFAGNIRYDAFAMGHLGFPTASNFLPYFTAGVGWLDSAPAYALGVGFEWGVYGNMALRGEMIGFGQVSPIPGVTQFPGISAWKITGGAVWQLGEGMNGRPEETFLASRDDTTDFTGLYTSAYLGAILNFPYNFFPDLGQGYHLTRASYGGSIGWNQEIANNIVAGVEVQGGLLFDTSGDITADTFAMARVGLKPVEGLFVYGEAGVGYLAGKTAYALGGGAEWALWGRNSLRADVIAIGELSSTHTKAGFSATKLLIGPVWHFD